MAIRTDAITEAELGKAFQWLTRNGMGPALGTRPIGWYQMHQCAALDVLRDAAGGHTEVRVFKGKLQGVVNGTWFGLNDPSEGYRHMPLTPTRVYALADARSRS